MRFASLYAHPITGEIMEEKMVLIIFFKNVILDSLFALLIFKIDFDSTRHLNTSKLSNSYSHLHAKRSFAKKVPSI